MENTLANVIRVKLLKRKNTGLGLLLRERIHEPCVAVAGLVPNGVAAESGLVQIGDVILKVNDISVVKMSYDQALFILENIPPQTPVILLLRGPYGFSTHLETIFLDSGVPRTRRITKPIQKVTPRILPNTPENILQNQNQPNVTKDHEENRQNKENVTPLVKQEQDLLMVVKTESDAESATTRRPSLILSNVKNGDWPSPEMSPRSRRGSSVTISGSPKRYQRLANLENSGALMSDTLHQKAVEPSLCTAARCVGSLLAPGGMYPTLPRARESLLAHAKDFCDQFYASLKRTDSAAHRKRWTEVQEQVEKTGSYDLTSSELNFGARTAWRNAARCIGRIQWSKLQVFDARHITTARGMFEALCNHIKYGTNKGNVRSAITVFPARTDARRDFRVWNSQLIGYAGYRRDGAVVGDPVNVEITEICERLGWKGPGGRFDILPLVLQASGQDPEMFEIPSELVLEVELTHPRFSWFGELGLKWYALPAVANMALDCGGLEFTAVPFNGWYMGTEIGARDLCDTKRYNSSKAVAERMGLDVGKSSSLWKDAALVEVNIAVLHSFQKAGVSITDHHSASESFIKHLENEQRLRGGCPADWVWIIPPISGSATHVFHQEMLLYKLKPSYEYQEAAWKTHIWRKDLDKNNTPSPRRKLGFKELARAVKFSAKLMGKALARRIKCTVLYASETGKAERYAKTACELFKHAFDAKMLCMADYDVLELVHETLVLVVSSTFGNGDPPENGENFSKALYEMKYPADGKSSHKSFARNIRQKSRFRGESNDLERSFSMECIEHGPLTNVRFAVFGLGSRAYPHFCAFAKTVDQLLEELGADRLQQLQEGDELCGQEQSFTEWAESVFKNACDTFCIVDDVNIKEATGTLGQSDATWQPDRFRLNTENLDDQPKLCNGLSKIHRKTIFPAVFVSKTNLQSEKSSRQTMLIKLSTGNHNADLTYLPGDHLAIFPANHDLLVEEVLAQLRNSPGGDAIVRLDILREKQTPISTVKSWVADERFCVLTLRRALKRYLDITSPPTPRFLSQLQNYAADQSDREKINKLVKDPELFEDWKFENQPNLAEIFREFKSVRPPATLLLTQLPLLQPRYYSISSSSAMHQGQIHLTVALVAYHTKGGHGPLHRGVCSSWLSELQSGDEVPCLVRGAAGFHLPDDASVPIIMVGPGTGIAPFRSFWQQRKVDREMSRTPESGWGAMSLYFGCRQLNIDNIYNDELNDEKKTGRMQVNLALSREPGKPKEYVQHQLAKNGKKVFETIHRNGGHFYVCGDVSMASDVTKTLEQIVQNESGLSDQELHQYFNKLRDDGRFHEDIFGVTFRTYEVNDKARAASKMSRSPKSSSSD